VHRSGFKTFNRFLGQEGGEKFNCMNSLSILRIERLAPIPEIESVADFETTSWQEPKYRMNSFRDAGLKECLVF
jgi:hypothetical protein